VNITIHTPDCRPMAEEARLGDELSRLLGWDPVIVSSVVENVAQSRSINDVQDIIDVSVVMPPESH